MSFRIYLRDWLKRRLEGSAPITPLQLAGWLRNLPLRRNQYSEKTLRALKARFEQEPTLFKTVFEHLSSIVPNNERSFWLFIFHDIWEILPPKCGRFPSVNFSWSTPRRKKIQNAQPIFSGCICHGSRLREHLSLLPKQVLT